MLPSSLGPGRRWIAGILLIVLVSGVANFRGLSQEKYNSDEGMWISISQKTWALFRSGDFRSPEWGSMDSSWGYVNPPVSKYLMGIALSAHGVEWEWKANERPPDDVLVAVRRLSASLAVISSLGILWIGMRTFSTSAGWLSNHSRLQE